MTPPQPRSTVFAFATDVLTVDVNNAVFDDKNVGSRTVTADVSLSGADAGNYTLTSSTASDGANITAASLTAVLTAQDKVYDGNTSAQATATVTAIGSDVVTVDVNNAVFDDKNVGSRTVTADVSLSGADAGNYTLISSTASDGANITVASLTAVLTAQDKTYDGNTSAQATATVTAIGNDVVTVDVNNAVFDDKNVGSRTVTADVSLSGADAGNYTLTSSTASDGANITAASLTAVLTAQDKVYDGNTSAQAAGK